MLGIALLLNTQSGAQHSSLPLPPSPIPPHAITTGHLRLPDLKAPFIALGSARLFSQTGTASADAQQPLLQFSSLSADLSLWEIPFSFNYTSSNGWQGLQPLNFGAARFDKEKYLQLLGNRLKGTAEPEELFSGYLNSLYAKRDAAIQKVRQDIAAILPAGDPQWIKTIMDKVNADNITYLGMDQLMDKLTASAGADILQKENSLLQLKAAGQPRDADSIATLERELSFLYQSKKQVEEKIFYLRKKWLDGGIMETISSFQKQKQALIDKLLRDPGAIARVASQHLNLRGLRKLMLHATSLNLGASQLDQSDLQLKNVLLNGVSAGFLKNNKYLAPVMGSQPGLKNIAEAGYANFAQLPDIFTTALRLGKGDIQKDFSHVSFALFQQGNEMQLLQNGLSRSLSQNFVTTLSKRVSFGSNHHLLAEISKSTMLYNGASQEKGDGLRNMVNSGNLMENMGIALDYDSELEGIGLSNTLSIRYTGKEYQNLGNAFLVGGTKEISNDLKKYFLGRRLVVHTRINYRQYEFSMNDRKWRSFSYLADVKWKLKKGEFVEVRYQPYFNRSNALKNNLNSASHRIALRANVNRKISRGLTYRNFIELATSDDKFHNAAFGNYNANRTISFTNLQTFVLGKRSLFVNITANRADQNTGFLFYNSSLSADAGAQFTAGNQVMLSTAVVYNRIDELYEQLAVRQSISAMLGKRLVAEGYLQLGKNLFEATGLGISPTTGNLSISYNLK